MSDSPTQRRIVIVDYGLGNLRSVKVALGRIGVEAAIGGTREQVAAADFLVIPGVGSFRQGMQNLQASSLISVLEEKVLTEKVPTLGICLGMQLFTSSSEEGACEGLGWIPGTTVRMDDCGGSARIPHVGRNVVTPVVESPLFEGIPAGAYFYFTHSYHVTCPSEYVVAETCYGHSFPSMIQKENIIGTQFHVEKSHTPGRTLLRNIFAFLRGRGA